MGATANTADEIKPLLELCRAGRLYDVEAWIREGKPIESPPNLRTTALKIAIDKGFHSLVEVLIKGGVNLDSRYNALEEAVSNGNYDIVKLLIDHGADVKSASFESACYNGDPRIIRLFMDHGADHVTRSPIAQALCSKNKAMLGIYKQYSPKFPELQRQADMALLHHVENGSLRGVCLLLWVGANPRAKVPEIGREDDSPDDCRSPLQRALWRGNLEMVKKMKPDSSQDNLDELLEDASHSQNSEVIKYLIGLGARLNDANRHSKALQWAFWHCLWSFDSTSHAPSRQFQSISFLQTLLELGAKWNPSDPHDHRTLRRTLRAMDAVSMMQLLQSLKKYQTLSDETLFSLVNTPKLKERMAPYASKVVEILPAFDRWAKGLDERNPTLGVPYSRSAGSGKPWGHWKWYNRGKSSS